MTFSISLSTKRHLLLALTSLVVAYVRTFLQYHRYSWDSISELLASWFVHYIAVYLLVAISYSVIKTHETRFLAEGESERRGLRMDEAFVYVAFVLLVCSISIFVVAHWPASGMLRE